VIEGMISREALERLKKLRDDLALQERLVGQQENIVAKYKEDRKRFHQTIKMSSTDEACREVISKVESSSEDPDEPEARKKLKRLEREKEEIEQEYDLILAAAKLWIQTIPDDRIRRILKLQYIENHSLQETADLANYSYQTVSNLISRFWAKTGK